MKPVIFDMDGVIIDSARVSDQLLIECGNKHGATITEKDLIELRGTSGRDFWAEIVRRYDLSYDSEYLRAQYDIDEEIRRYSDPGPIDGVVDLIRHLSAEGRRLALATSAQRRRMEAVLELFGLRDLFDVTVNSDEVTRSKLDPQIFLLAAEKLQVEPHECIVIEDSPGGIRAARAAGMTVVGFYGLVGSSVHLPDADLLIDGFSTEVLSGL